MKSNEQRKQKKKKSKSVNNGQLCLPKPSRVVYANRLDHFLLILFAPNHYPPTNYITKLGILHTGAVTATAVYRAHVL